MNRDKGEVAEALKTPHEAANEAMLQWWSQQWFQGTTPLARMQLAWMESLAEAMQFEAQCLHALAESGERMAGCSSGDPSKAPEELQQCYQEFLEHVTQTHMQRLNKVAQLSEDFRKRVWEEI